MSIFDTVAVTPSLKPAEPGAYGRAPKDFRLPADLRLGPVRLQVADLERSVDFYRQVLGMTLLAEQPGRAVLGGPDLELVELRELPGARPAPARGRLGLYHFAILLPDRPSLGRFVRHLADLGVRAGSADHHVSEAIYLQDPDGLGIEVYADRPRSRWQRRGRELHIGTEALDVSGLVRSAGSEPWPGVPAGTVMGHLHLHVGDLEDASAFYSEALGFDRIAETIPGALFVGAGGYHHHLGTNTWSGRGATPAADDEARLLEWTIELPGSDDLEAVAASLERHGYSFERASDGGSAGGLLTRDPWGTALRLQARATA